MEGDRRGRWREVGGVGGGREGGQGRDRECEGEKEGGRSGVGIREGRWE